MTEQTQHEIWVTITDGAELVGYSRTGLANAITRMLEKQRKNAKYAFGVNPLVLSCGCPT